MLAAAISALWLETALGIGSLRVGIFAPQLVCTLICAQGVVLDSPAPLWAPAFRATFALYMPSETHVLTANDLFWIMYVVVAAELALDVPAAKRSAAA